MKFYDLDIDVKNYVKRIIDAGNPIPADIQAVSDFIKGLKAYNIYYSLIDAWFLRGTQNAGRGTTVYGFKKFNGTIINGGIWQSDGIECIPTRYIDVRLQFNIVNTICAFSVARSFAPMPGFTSGFPHQLALSGNSYTVGNQYAIYSRGSNGNSWNMSADAALDRTSTYTRVLRGLWTPDSHSISINGGTIVRSTSTPLPGINTHDRIIFGGRWSSNTVEAAGGSFGVGFRGTHIAEFIFDSPIDNTIFYNLFKSTVGRGLALP